MEEEKQACRDLEKVKKVAASKLLVMTNANCSTICDIFSLWFLFTVLLGFPRVTRVLTKNVGLFI